jgi:hypothetical protein
MENYVIEPIEGEHYWIEEKRHPKDYFVGFLVSQINFREGINEYGFTAIGEEGIWYPIDTVNVISHIEKPKGDKNGTI